MSDARSVLQGAGTGADPAPPPAAGVGGRVLAGGRWSLANNIALRLGIFTSGLVLARLLSPQDYGVFAVALVVLTLLQSMNELGVSLAVVRWQADLRTFAPTVLTLAVASSAVLYVLCWTTAPAIAAGMGAPSAAPVIRVLCVCVIVDGFATVPNGILNREFLQGRRLVCDVGCFCTTTAVTVTLAVRGHGAMSFAVGALAGSLVALTGVTLLAPTRIRPGWDPALVRPLLAFGLPLAGSSLLVLATTNVDKIIVGASLDPVALGLYLMAFNQSSWPLTVFSDAARRVSLAGFALLAHDRAALERAFNRGLWLLLAVTVPVSVGLCVYADPMLRFLYGDRWSAAAPVLRWLAILGLVRVALFVAYDLLVALDRGRLLVILQGTWMLVLVPAMVLGAHLDGIRGVGIAHVAVALLVVVPAFGLALRRLGLRPSQVLRNGLRPVLGGLLAAASAWPVLASTDGSLARLAIGGTVLLAVYLPIVAPMQRLLPGRDADPRPTGRHIMSWTSRPETP